MPSTHQNRISGYVRLRTQVRDGGAEIVPQERQRYRIVEQRAAEALRLANEAAQFRKQFRYALTILGEWVRSRSDVRDAYVTVADGSLLFVAVRNRVEFSEEFDDSLSELDLRIAGDTTLDLIDLNTLSMPDVSEAALQQFLSPEMTMVYERGEGS